MAAQPVRLGVLLQIGKPDKPRALDDPTRPYIKFDIVAHLDTLSSHEVKRVSQHLQTLSTMPLHWLRYPYMYRPSIHPSVRPYAVPYIEIKLTARFVTLE